MVPWAIEAFIMRFLSRSELATVVYKAVWTTER